MATYKAIRLEGKGSVDQLRSVELPIPEPGPGEVRVRVEATGIGATDLVMRSGNYPYAPAFPFVPGYDVVGRVEAVGSGVTTHHVGDRVGGLVVHGGYGEVMVREAEHFLPVPEGLDAAKVVALILNYVTAYQMLHRVARLGTGQSALVLGASGGVGSAMLELCRDAGVKAYGAAAGSKRAGVEQFGAIALDSRAAEPVDRQLRAREPGGVDAAFDPLSGRFAGVCVRSVRRGGRVVWYGFSAVTRGDGSTDLPGLLRGALTTFVGGPLTLRWPSFYGITQRYRKDPTTFREDFAKVVDLYTDGKIDPRIDARVRLDDVRDAQTRLERGDVDGKLVIVFPA
ncbi:MAG: alcohol dehydrogenase catalytic domain-containing protein [Myxococcota bacterium]